MDLQLYCGNWDQQPKANHNFFLKVRTPHDSRHDLKLFPAVHNGIYASAAYLAKYLEPKHPLELDSHVCLGYDRVGGFIPWKFSKDKEHLTLKPDFSIAAADACILCRSTVRGVGISVMPVWEAVPYLRTSELVPILRKWTPDPIAFCALHAGRLRLCSEEGAFLNFLDSILGTERDPRCRGEDPRALFVHT